MDSFKNKYGEVFSPNYLVDKMIELLPNKLTSDFCLRWLDPGSGEGQFTLKVYTRLFKNLEVIFKNKREREKHIIQNMLHMVEINPINVEKTLDNFSLFSHTPNIKCENYLNYNVDLSYDVIIGNPPFNFNGDRKVPTKKNTSKKNDGSTIWVDFIRKSIDLLNDNGYLCFITPSIWLKPDKQKCYELLTQYQIHHMICFTNTETNKIFSGQAQTPTVIFTLEKTPKYKETLIFDKDYQSFIPFNITNNTPIPVFGISIINKLLYYTKKYGSISKYIKKTNCPGVNIKFICISKNGYQNISTCKIISGNKPTLITNTSNIPCQFHNIPKIVLAHKMYGFPYFDKNGTYGISSRDNYVIIHDNLDILNIFYNFLSTHFALYIFESTRYRMKYLEKYVFEFIPDVSNIPDFPDIINDDTICTFFNLNNNDKNHINKLHNKKYTFFNKID